MATLSQEGWKHLFVVLLAVLVLVMVVVLATALITNILIPEFFETSAFRP
ncbi:hypothetical protein [Natronomonas amylolytica]